MLGGPDAILTDDELFTRHVKSIPEENGPASPPVINEPSGHPFAADSFDTALKQYTILFFKRVKEVKQVLQITARSSNVFVILLNFKVGKGFEHTDWTGEIQRLCVPWCETTAATYTWWRETPETRQVLALLFFRNFPGRRLMEDAQLLDLKDAVLYVKLKNRHNAATRTLPPSIKHGMVENPYDAAGKTSSAPKVFSIVSKIFPYSYMYLNCLNKSSCWI
jgi:hypothetical protein